jgi:hypothetical protein
MYKSFILHCSDLELKAATLHFTESIKSIKSILRISEVLGSSRKKKEVENYLLSCLVPRTCLPAGRRIKVAARYMNFYQNMCLARGTF